LGQLFAKNKANLRQKPERSVNHFRDWLAKTPAVGLIGQGDSGHRHAASFATD
jgi:hypothetical protein